MKTQKPFSKNTKTVSALTDAEMQKIFGGICEPGAVKCEDPSNFMVLPDGTLTSEPCPVHVIGPDSIDCTSELASGGTTTDTYE